MELREEEGRMFAADQSGKLLAEITFPRVHGDLVDLNHTFVDASLQGRGIAGELVQAAAERFRRDRLKAVVTCSYAAVWFEKHPEYADVLATYSGPDSGG